MSAYPCMPSDRKLRPSTRAFEETMNSGILEFSRSSPELTSTTSHNNGVFPSTFNLARISNCTIWLRLFSMPAICNNAIGNKPSSTTSPSQAPLRPQDSDEGEGQSTAQCPPCYTCRCHQLGQDTQSNQDGYAIAFTPTQTFLRGESGKPRVQRRGSRGPR